MNPTTYPEWDEFLRTSFARGREFPMIAPETPSFMGLPHAATPAELEGGGGTWLLAPAPPGLVDALAVVGAGDEDSEPGEN